jgi:excisionase family DNA binding protein
MAENKKSETLTPFCNITEAARRTGMSEWFIRQHIGEIPHCKSGKKYLIHVEGLMEYALKTGETA